jgi:hypothetical protein
VGVFVTRMRCGASAAGPDAPLAPRGRNTSRAARRRVGSAAAREGGGRGPHWAGRTRRARRAGGGRRQSQGLWEGQWHGRDRWYTGPQEGEGGSGATGAEAPEAGRPGGARGPAAPWPAGTSRHPVGPGRAAGAQAPPVRGWDLDGEGVRSRQARSTRNLQRPAARRQRGGQRGKGGRALSASACKVALLLRAAALGAPPPPKGGPGAGAGGHWVQAGSRRRRGRPRGQCAAPRALGGARGARAQRRGSLALVGGSGAGGFSAWRKGGGGHREGIIAPPRAWWRRAARALRPPAARRAAAARAGAGCGRALGSRGKTLPCAAAGRRQAHCRRAAPGSCAGTAAHQLGWVAGGGAASGEGEQGGGTGRARGGRRGWTHIRAQARGAGRLGARAGGPAARRRPRRRKLGGGLAPARGTGWCRGLGRGRRGAPCWHGSWPRRPARPNTAAASPAMGGAGAGNVRVLLGRPGAAGCSGFIVGRRGTARARAPAGPHSRHSRGGRARARAPAGGPPPHASSSSSLDDRNPPSLSSSPPSPPPILSSLPSSLLFAPGLRHSSASGVA